MQLDEYFSIYCGHERHLIRLISLGAVLATAALAVAVVAVWEHC